ncbi:isoform 1 of glycerol kinase [Aspergillus udagawae]|uniref:glycerol kinase n=1 Tax=Aspergillus udagawae TaxID=91492 RepID=A0A8H3RXK0_9EURO|nr:glycerol kinase [Aspergillus udagawae]GFF27180.1 isoform 1 of glycerol kinase [Aspergillus udagawae]GFF41447.1 isoform 1 of glycerol kinase [Aspergillus udagawae]GFF74374.1 isoform 1 of glycerol kinase [Aspergillus udagawae]GFG01283.1 isoform 1 of glycerol kinase [Aspergillus udagawae]GFG22515.1 isoform 1 of glycerol kinase [Aspergillus udagawae]
MRNPFDLTELDNAVEEQQRPIDISAYQSHDGNRSLLQDENRRGDNLKDRFIGAIDQGTTSSRFIIFDCTGVPVAKYQTEFRQIHEHSGWHEHDPLELVDSVYTCIEEAMKTFLALGHSKSDIEAIGITSQRETTLCWDWETGEPLHNAIAWPDTRTKNLVRELKGQEGADELPGICGLPLSTYPSSVSLVWLLRHSPQVKQAYDEGRLAFGTVDSWLLYNLNGGPEAGRHVTDVTNASRTMFMNLETLEYDDKLLNFFGIDKKKIRLPKILPSSDPDGYGYVRFGPLDGVPITSCLGDQSAALVGHCAFTPGTAKNTYGTGCFLLYNVGEKPVISKHGLLATVGFQLGKNRKPVYALEGSVAVAGSGISFLMNNLGFFRDSRKVSDLAATVPDSGGCVFVTAFSGLFAPYWIDDAKGTIFGITQHTQRGHIARATMEAACFQTKAILDAMARDSGHNLSELAVDGGMSNSDICMQTQADIIQIPVERPAMHETTALGAAIAAGFAIDVWKEFSELKNMNRANRTTFTPRISPAQSARMYKQWSKAVEMSRGWLDTSEIESEGQE